MDRLDKELKEEKYFKVAMFYEVKDWAKNNETEITNNDVWEIVDKMNNDQQLNEEISDCIAYYYNEMRDAQ